MSEKDLVQVTPQLTQDQIKQRLAYDPETGLFEWKDGRRRGKQAGSLNTSGYIEIFIGQRRCGAHRLAFFFMTGSWPDGIVDHKDCVRTNNRWDNLRVATPSQNCANRVSKSAAGMKGVYRHRKRFKAAIAYKVDGKNVNEYLGLFRTPESAHAAYLEAISKRYGEYSRGA